MNITFVGATREVTGSCYLVQTAETRFLVDCGMVQGGREAPVRNRRPFAFAREQAPNAFITPELAFRFRDFALRKMHFLLRARALIAFPGGYGTLDELFEVLTLVQTGKMTRLPIVLVGSEFWRRVVDFDHPVDEGFVSARDLQLFTSADTAEQIISVLEDVYGGRPPRAEAGQK